MFNRRSLLKSSPLAALALVANPRFIQGPSDLVVPSHRIETPLSQPLVIATDMPLTKIGVSKGWIMSIDIGTPMDRVESIFSTEAAYVRGQPQCKVVMHLTQFGNLQTLMGKEVTLYVEED